MTSRLIDLLVDCEIFNYSLALTQVRNEFMTPANICNKTLYKNS